MRLIGTLADEGQAHTFSRFLSKQGIAHQLEIKAETDWGSASYGAPSCQIWIHEEHEVAAAVEWLHTFQNDPQNPLFHAFAMPVEDDVPPQPVPSAPFQARASPWEQQPMGGVTRLLIALCCMLFFWSQLEPSLAVPARYARLVPVFSPVEQVLLYDYPQLYELLFRFIERYGQEEVEQPSALSPAARALFDRIQRSSVWPGFYDLLAAGGISAASQGWSAYPTFEKIRQGEYWRIFSPILLHGNVLHLLFNMLWLAVLGKQLEQRLRVGRYLILILVVAAVSNTAQYLTSGPNFLGFSGVLCGMLAFIWVRQKEAPWEGYRIDRATFMFMFIFVFGLVALQGLAFLAESLFQFTIPSNMANMAHVSGGCAGWILGRWPFFSWRPT